MADTKEPSSSGIEAMPSLGQAFPTEAAPADTADTSYKPLSILSLVGFGIALLYSVYMVTMAGTALWTGKPALISLFTLLIPLVAIVVCFLGRIQIALSENTIAGRNLTTWGISLAVVVSLTYFAYNLAVYLALRNQAEAFAQEWMTELTQEDNSQAALKVLTPVQRLDLEGIDDPQVLTREINLKVKNSDKDAPQQFMRYFRQNEMVRMLGDAGPGTKIEFKGLRSWEYVGKAYEVTLTYRITTPDQSSTDAVVVVRGMEAERDEFTGRKWHIDLRRSGFPREPETPAVYSEAGRKNGDLVQSAHLFVNNWNQNLATVRSDKAMLALLPPEERKKGEELLGAEMALGAASGSGYMTARPTPDGPLKKAEEVSTGQFITLTGKVFSTNKNRLLAAEKARAALTYLGRDDAVRLDIERIPPRRFKDEKRGRLQYHFDVRIIVAPKDMLTGILVVECDAAALDKPAGTPVEWQMIRLELQGAEDPPDSAGPGGR